MTSNDPRPDLRSKALADPLRPRFHFTAPAGWMNDPNGVCQRDGVFHLFYQYNPDAAEHHRIQWGHAASSDLMHWEDRPIALVPDAIGPDADGCWSGVLVDDAGRPVIVYSGHADSAPTQTACLAHGDASLDTWVKDRANPVIPGPPPGYEVTAFRDHCVWRENGTWRQLMGSGIRGTGGCAFLYESDDLISWRALGPLAIGDAGAVPAADDTWTGTMWECVDFFRLRADGTTAAPSAASDEEHVLIFSAWDDGITRHPLSAHGRYHGDRFEIAGIQRLDLGGRHAYAPQTFMDEKGRRVLWAWMQEARDVPAQREAGWSGAMIVPRRLRLDEDAVLRQEPVAEAELLRGAPLEWTTDGRAHVSSGVQVDLEFEVVLPRSGGSVRIDMFSSGDGREVTSAMLTRSADDVAIELDRSHSSVNPNLDQSPHRGTVPGPRDRLPVRVLLDRSSIEVFVDGIALTTRVYPTLPQARSIRLEPADGAEIHDLRGWHDNRAEQEERTNG